MIIKTIIDEIRAVITAVLDLIDFFKKWKAARVALYCGKWTNEGCVNCPQPTHYLDIELFPTKHGISGIVSSRSHNSKLPNGSFYGRLNLQGKLRGTVSDISQGRLTLNEVVTMSIRGENLDFITRNSLVSFLPQKTRMFRSDLPEEFKPVLR